MAKCKYKSKLNLLYECPEDGLPDSDDGFCIFHERRKDKDIQEFNAGIKAKMENKDYDFTGYYFPEDIDFSKYNEGKFDGPAFFDEANFQGRALFSEAEFKHPACFAEAEFQETASFRDAKFQGEASFDGAEFQGVAGFEKTEFQGEASFVSAEFRGQSWFWVTKFEQLVRFDRAAFQASNSFISTVFQSDAYFDRTGFENFCVFAGAQFRGAAWFGTAEFEKLLLFQDTHFRYATDAENVYRRAKIAWQREGHYTEAGYYHLQEMRARRKARLERLKKDLETFKEESPAKKSVHIARVRFLQGLERVFIDWTCGYGEQWWRVILTALTLVFGCAFLYYFFFPITSTSPDIQITGIGWGYFKDCLYFSFVTFTTLGYGDLRPMPEVWTRAVASIEAFTGAFMIALFVLCFARKWMR